MRVQDSRVERGDMDNSIVVGLLLFAIIMALVAICCSGIVTMLSTIG